MSILDTRISKLKGIPGGKVSERLMHEISYARRVSNVQGHRWDELILGAVAMVEKAYAEDGVLTDAKALAAEEALLPMQEAALSSTGLSLPAIEAALTQEDAP